MPFQNSAGGSSGGSSSSSAGGPGAPSIPAAATLPNPAAPPPVNIPYPNTSMAAASTSSSTKVNYLQCKGLSKEGATSAVAGKPLEKPVDKAMLRGLSAGQSAPSAGSIPIAPPPTIGVSVLPAQVKMLSVT